MPSPTDIPPPTVAPSPYPQAPAPRPSIVGRIGLILAIIGAVLAALGPLAFLAWLFTLPALILGIVGVASKGRKKGTSLAAIIVSSVAFLLAVIVSISVIASSSHSSGSQSPNSPTLKPSATPTPSKKPKSAPAKTEAPKPESTPKPTPHAVLNDREFQILLKDPDSQKGKKVTFYAYVAQFDSATGTCALLADIAPTEQPDSWSYTERAWITSDSKSCPALASVVQGDHLKIDATVWGSYTYDNTMGGGNTVPAFKLDSLQALQPLEE